MRTLLAKYCPLLLLGAAVSVQVEPPTNITFHCHNMHNVLRWSYGEMVPGLRFRINIDPYYTPDPDEENLTKPKWVEPPALQADLSQLSNPNNDYTVYVTAVVGANESTRVPSNEIMFSYYKSTVAPYKCFVDFPPVNVSAEETTVQIHFVHPWFLYGGRPLAKSARKDVPELKYEVVLLSQNSTKHSSCRSRLCSAKLRAHTAQEKYCVEVEGEMEDMLVKGKQKSCGASPSVEPPREINYTIIFAIIAVISLLFAVALILCMVYKKKTEANTPHPQTLTFPERLKQLTLGVVPERVSVPQVEPSSPTQLLDPESNVSTPDPEPTPAHLDLRLPLRPPGEGGGAGEEVAVELDDALASEYVSGKELEDEDEDEDEGASLGGSSTGYEKRVNASVQLAQDETLKGYRGCRRSGEKE